MGKYMAKLIIIWYDNFGEKHTSLLRRSMTAIPKISTFFDHFFGIVPCKVSAKIAAIFTF